MPITVGFMYPLQAGHKLAIGVEVANDSPLQERTRRRPRGSLESKPVLQERAGLFMLSHRENTRYIEDCTISLNFTVLGGGGGGV